MSPSDAKLIALRLSSDIAERLTVLSSRQLSALLNRPRTTIRDEIDRVDEAEVSP